MIFMIQRNKKAELSASCRQCQKVDRNLAGQNSESHDRCRMGTSGSLKFSNRVKGAIITSTFSDTWQVDQHFHLG